MKHSHAQSILLACETCLGTGIPRAQQYQQQPHSGKKTAYHPKDCCCCVWDSTEMTALQDTREKSTQILHSHSCSQAEHTQNYTKHCRTQQCQSCNSIIPLVAAKVQQAAGTQSAWGAASVMELVNMAGQPLDLAQHVLQRLLQM